MSKIYKNFIFKTVFSGVLAFGAVLALPAGLEAYAVRGGYSLAPDAPLPPLNPRPAIFSISPKSADLYAGEQIITIHGAGFSEKSVAKWDGTDRPTAYMSPSRLQIKLHANDMAHAGEHLITVENPAPGGGVSHPEIFKVVAPRGGFSASSSDGNVLGADSQNKGNSGSYDDNMGRRISGSAVNSDSSFFPSTFMQWLALAIIILLIVIIWRRLYRRKEEELPLKHA